MKFEVESLGDSGHHSHKADGSVDGITLVNGRLRKVDDGKGGFGMTLDRIPAELLDGAKQGDIVEVSMKLVAQSAGTQHSTLNAEV